MARILIVVRHHWCIFNGHHNLMKLNLDHKADLTLGNSNASAAVYTFMKNGGDGIMSKDELLSFLGAKEEVKERTYRFWTAYWMHSIILEASDIF
ncbi:hypothetical protein E1B28_002967 [Marasmius oreades]|uniref:Uncharacterized protein n=1 Tax=Marasmius oreades TaxID=181124 RepID=A0A9P7RJK3_9AGAR|nr:uncharacterized protein E1B28_002967 [Marasmius oreades]KAG7085406.1 hypothetical protein E1B28_002967 [Marasmius oreades]